MATGTVQVFGQIVDMLRTTFWPSENYFQPSISFWPSETNFYARVKIFFILSAREASSGS